jgi:hypothetical protein
MSEKSPQRPPAIEGYEIFERLGSGGMGTVFRARHLALDRVVALKILRPSISRNARQVERLQREARVVAHLDHPNIVRGYDFGLSGSHAYFSMEYVAGSSLRDILKERTLTETEALDILDKVAQALSHAHSSGVVHRDVKPANVMITEKGEVKLADLGLAKVPEQPSLTHAGATIGTPQYISPEQAQDPRNADARSDLYSLGATFHHMVTGSPPFAGEGIGEVIAKVLFTPPVPLRRIRPEMSVGAERLALRLMAKDPAHRPRSADDLLALVARLKQGESIPAPRERAGVWRLLLSATAVVVLVVVAVMLLKRGGAPEPVVGESEGSDPVEAGSASLLHVIEEIESRELVPAALVDLFVDCEAIERQLVESGTGGAVELEERLRRRQLEVQRRFDDVLALVLARVEDEAERLVKRGDQREAVALFSLGLEESGFGRALSRELRRGISDLPESFLQRVERRREEAEGRVRPRASRSLTESILARCAWRPVGDGTASFVDLSSRAALLSELDRRLEDVGDLLLASDFLRVGDRLEQARGELRQTWRGNHRRREGEVLELLDARKFESARRRIDALGDDGIFHEIPQLVDKQDELRSFATERERDALLEEEERHHQLVLALEPLLAAKDYLRVRVMLAERLRELEPMADESSDLEGIRWETAAYLIRVELLERLWSRVEVGLRQLVGKSDKVVFRGNRFEKEIISVEAGIVRYRFVGSNRESEASVHDLDPSEVARFAPARGAGQTVALAFLFLDQAVSETNLTRRKSLLVESRKELDRARALAGARGEDPDLPRGFFDWAGRRVSAAESMQEESDAVLARAVEDKLMEAEDAFARAEYEQAEELFVALMQDPVTRPSYRQRREEIDDKLAVCRRARSLRELDGRLVGSVIPVAGPKNRVRILYDFESAEQLADWKGPGERFAVVGGHLVCRPPPGRMTGSRFKAVTGIQYRAELDVYRGVSLEFDLLTQDEPGPFFMVVSLLGNNLGVFSRGQPGDPRRGQLNTWTGDIADYENYFHLAGRFLREPRGIVDFRFEPGRRYRVTLEITDYARQIRFLVDGVLVLERELTHAAREGEIEIRSWFGHELDDLQLEGVVLD